MLIIIRVTLAVIVAILAGYGLLTKNFDFQPYMLFFLSLMIVMMGVEEFRKGRKRRAWINIGIFLFILIVSLQGFFLN